MSRKTIFLSFDYDNDQRGRDLLLSWDKNKEFNFEFYEGSLREAINGADAIDIKYKIGEKILAASHLLCLVGKESSGSDWIAWEIQTAIENKKKLIGVKIETANTSPVALSHNNTVWARAFDFEAIKNAVVRSEHILDPADTERKRPWILALRYLTVVALGNLLWETAQLPLYTIWASGTRGELVFAVAHCTVGDVMIAASCLGIAALLVGRRPGRIAAIAIPMGVAYTMFSEWLNVVIRETWAYAPAMPILPIVGTGLAPLAQWVVVPTLAYLWAIRRYPLG